MKTCPICALELEDAYLFCPDDGSSLATAAGDSANKGAATGDLDNVLYCPTCAAAYPLIFSHCPVHYVKLTKNRIIVPEKLESTNQPVAEAPELPVSDQASDCAATPLESHEAEHQPYRVAALATVVALAVIGIIGLYTVISHLSRRPSHVAQAAQVTALVENEPTPYIQTPQAARDYREEHPAPAPRVDRADGVAGGVGSPSSVRREEPKKAVTAAPTRAPATTRMADLSNPEPIPVQRGNSTGFDSRLVRLQARRTTFGYRYDLTFNMQERAGHWAQWQRALITTRSASGINRSEAIPFAHRLGATGALTFTISVEMSGRSESDWRGRVACTTLGWDQNGGPLQAAFGANVTP
jgi:hypothetical protein